MNLSGTRYLEGMSGLWVLIDRFKRREGRKGENDSWFGGYDRDAKVGTVPLSSYAGLNKSRKGGKREVGCCAPTGICFRCQDCVRTKYSPLLK